MSHFLSRIGDSQTLSMGSVSLTLADTNFKIENGEGYITQLGYDRVEKANLRRSYEYATQGVPYRIGGAVAAKLEFEWRLQLLSEAQWLALVRLDALQQRNGGAIRLVDQRLAIEEPSPRTRAKVGSLISTASGFVCYWPQFNIHLESMQITTRSSGWIEAVVKAIELDRVPTSEDA